MRPQTNLRARWPRAAAKGVLTTAIAVTAATPLVAAVAGAADAPPAISVADATVAYGHAVEVDGSAAGSQSGHQASLEYGSGRAAWRVVKTTTVDAGGRYHLVARLPRSGSVRVAVGDLSAVRGASTADVSTVQRSAPQRVAVAAKVTASARKLDVLSGETATVAGRIRPGGAGRLVRLERRASHGWRAVARDRTDRSGRYALRYRTHSTGISDVRVKFLGDSANAAAVRHVGRLRTYRQSLASRYDAYGGALACGGSLGYNAMVVANKSLPCGTHLTIRYHGHVANAVVRDRGPYAGGREFDLAGAVARKLHFDGVGTIWVTS